MAIAELARRWPRAARRSPSSTTPSRSCARSPARRCRASRPRTRRSTTPPRSSASCAASSPSPSCAAWSRTCGRRSRSWPGSRRPPSRSSRRPGCSSSCFNRVVIPWSQHGRPVVRRRGRRRRLQGDRLRPGRGRRREPLGRRQRPVLPGLGGGRRLNTIVDPAGARRRRSRPAAPPFGTLLAAIQAGRAGAGPKTPFHPNDPCETQEPPEPRQRRRPGASGPRPRPRWTTPRHAAGRAADLQRRGGRDLHRDARGPARSRSQGEVDEGRGDAEEAAERAAASSTKDRLPDYRTRRGPDRRRGAEARTAIEHLARLPRHPRPGRGRAGRDLGTSSRTQRLRIPVLEETPFQLKAELETAQAVTPGQGQTVRVAGVRVGDIAEVEYDDGVAVVTMDIDQQVPAGLPGRDDPAAAQDRAQGHVPGARSRAPRRPASSRRATRSRSPTPRPTSTSTRCWRRSTPTPGPTCGCC